MDKLFRIGSFAFRLRCPEEVMPPPNFLLFKCADLPWYVRNGESEFRDRDGKEKGLCDVRWEYTYEIRICETLPEPTGSVVARRPDLVVFREDSGTQEGKKDDAALESRLIGVKGTGGYYACYRETGPDCAEVYLARDRIDGLHFDPMFTSLMALERRMIRKDSLILHCAYMVYHGEAILFSAPSETGKTTQANLWETYRGSRTVNGDRALLGKIDGRWNAQGWPVCGTSEVCSDEAFPIRAIVMLSQAKENLAVRMTPGQAFPLLYSQITVNRWNMQDHLHAMDLMEKLLAEVSVYHLGCTISEEAVECLENALRQEEPNGRRE